MIICTTIILVVHIMKYKRCTALHCNILQCNAVHRFYFIICTTIITMYYYNYYNVMQCIVFIRIYWRQYTILMAKNTVYSMFLYLHVS